MPNTPTKSPAILRAPARNTRTRVAALALAPALALALPATANAQPDASDPNATPPHAQISRLLSDTTRSTRDVTDRWVIDALTRLLLERIRQIQDPSDIDYAITALALRVAQSVTPADPELVRAEADAWNAAGDRQRARDASRRLLQLEPDNDVLQLSIIADAAKRLQTVNQRLDFYNNAINDNDLGPAVRSRLALDAALLAREAADNERFIQLLTTATVLDVTNKPAASLFATVFLDSAQTPLERIEILANVVLADPLDPAAHGNLATEFLRHAAYRQALRFIDRRRDTLFSDTLTDLLDRTLCLWQTEGPDAALEIIARLQQSADLAYSAQRAQQLEQGIPPGPELAQLIPARLEIARLIVLHALAEDADQRAFENATPDNVPANLQLIEPVPAPVYEALGIPEPNTPFATQHAFKRVIAAINNDIAILQSPPDTIDPANIPSPEELQRGIRETRLERVWVRLFAERDVLNAERELDELITEARQSGQALPPASEARFKGWILALKGFTNDAIQTLAPIAPDDPSAAWALAATHERVGDNTQAVRTYLLLAKHHPQTLLAAAAKHRAEVILGTSLAPTRTAQDLDAYGRRFAPWIDEFTQDPRSAVRVVADFDTDLVRPLDRPRLRITLRNLGPAPLAIGARSSVPPSLLLTPQLTVGDNPIPAGLGDVFKQQFQERFAIDDERAEALANQQIRSLSQRMLEVVNVQRRLRLDPRSAFEITVRPGRGFAGSWLDQDLTAFATLRHRLTLGFQNTETDIIPTSNAITAQTRMLNRVALPKLSPDTPPDLATITGIALYTELLRVSSRLNELERLAPSPENDAETQSLRNAVADRAASMTPDELAFTIARLGPSAQLNEDTAPLPQLEQAVLALDTPPAPTLIKLILLVPRDAEHPLFDAAARHPNTDLQQLAAIIRNIMRTRAEDAATPDAAEPAK